MYTLCSHCQAEYEVAPELLVRDRGWLHCSACERDFDALGNLSKTPRTDIAPPLALPSREHELPVAREEEDAALAVEAEAAADEVLVAAEEAMEPDPLEVETSDLAHADTGELDGNPEEPALARRLRDGGNDGEVSTRTNTDEIDPEQPGPEPHESEKPITETHEPQAPAAADETPHTSPSPTIPAPSFAKRRIHIPVAAVQRGARWRWVAIAVLSLLLVVQVALSDRERFAADARTRPWVEKLCRALPCDLPPWREPSAMQLMARDVRPHPSVPDALIISASFRNDARWEQPWPHLNLTLSNINGQTIAQRQFEPDEYLGLGARELTIEPGQTASVTLEVTDPGKQAVAFEFEFR